MKKKVVILERIFSSYRKPVFDLLSRHVVLQVLHGTNNSGIKPVSAPYSHLVPVIQYTRNETNVLLFPFQKIRKFKPRVVISDFAIGILNLPFIMLYCKMMGIKFVFWSHGYNRKTGFNPAKSIADKYRLKLLKAADANIVYGEADKKILQPYLLTKKVFVAQNTIDTSTLLAIRKQLEVEGTINIKERLGVHHKYNIIYISRLLPAKHPELLVDIYENLKSVYGLTVGVHFIGDGEMLPVIKQTVEAKGYGPDFYFHGQIHDSLINGALLFISDIMVIPGDLGLSVNHSFCFDCPVVSFASKNGSPAHGPESEYIINNETGFLISVHTSKAMADTIYPYLLDDALKNKMKINIRHSIENLTIENMVQGVLDCIEHVADDDNKRGIKSLLNKKNFTTKAAFLY